MLTAGFCLPAPAPAADTGEADGVDGRQTTADVYQRRISENINSAAQWVDSFFDDERYAAEDASSKLRIGQSVFLEYGNNPELNTSINLSMDVPRTESKLKIFIGGEDDTNKTASSSNDNDLGDSDTGGSAAGLQFFAKASNRQNLSLAAGVRLSSTELFVGPRYRINFRLDGWLLRFTERVRWYTRRGWESRSRFDFERVLSNHLFFRQTWDGRWREEDPGYRYELRTSLFQPIRSRKAVEYQWVNLFKTSPNHRLESTVLRIRYRQSIWRKWLFYEMNPQLAFRNDEDFKPKAGVVLRLEAVFGGKDFLKHR